MSAWVPAGPSTWDVTHQTIQFDSFPITEAHSSIQMQIGGHIGIYTDRPMDNQWTVCQVLATVFAERAVRPTSRKERQHRLNRSLQANTLHLINSDSVRMDYI